MLWLRAKLVKTMDLNWYKDSSQKVYLRNNMVASRCHHVGCVNLSNTFNQLFYYICYALFWPIIT